MDLFTNTDRKSNLGTPHVESSKGYNVSQVQKLKIDLAEKQKNQKSRSNSLARNSSMDGNRKKFSFKKKASQEALKKNEKRNQPICSYVGSFFWLI